MTIVPTPRQWDDSHARRQRFATAGARNAAGWQMCLDLLDRVVSGSREAAASDAGMEEFLPVLEKYKALGVPDDGWLPDPPSS